MRRERRSTLEKINTLTKEAKGTMGNGDDRNRMKNILYLVCKLVSLSL
jgi:hypothetical protein